MCLAEALGQWLTAMIHIMFRSLEEWMPLILMERDLKTDCIQKTNRHYNCKLNSTPNINLKLNHIFKMVRQRPEIKWKTKKKPSLWNSETQLIIVKRWFVIFPHRVSGEHVYLFYFNRKKTHADAINVSRHRQMMRNVQLFARCTTSIGNECVSYDASRNEQLLSVRLLVACFIRNVKEIEICQGVVFFWLKQMHLL